MRNRLGNDRCEYRHGTIMVLMVLLLPVILLLAAIAINIAYIELGRTEMVIAADAAARAGGREFIVTGSKSTAKSRAMSIALKNNVAGKPVTLKSNELVFGTSIRPTPTSRYQFTPGGSDPNSLQVSINRNSLGSDGPISLLMPNIVGSSSTEMSTQQAISTQIEVDIGLVVDRSGSMAYGANEVADPYVPPASAPAGWTFGQAAPPNCRWRDLVDAVEVFTEEIDDSPGNEMISLSSYSDWVSTDVSMTDDYDTILTAMDTYTQAFQSGATNIGGGLIEGNGAIQFSPSQRPGAAKVLVLLTDGKHNTGTNPISAANTLASQGVMIITVTFANEADQALMQQVATIGHGRHFHASTASELSLVFQQIAISLPTLLTK